MPDIVRFFTGEDALLQNVPTWRCREPDALAHVLDNLAHLVVKEVSGSGGYGMLVGPHATKREIDEFGRKIRTRPRASSPSRHSLCRHARPSCRRASLPATSTSGPSC